MGREIGDETIALCLSGVCLGFWGRRKGETEVLELGSGGLAYDCASCQAAIAAVAGNGVDAVKSARLSALLAFSTAAVSQIRRADMVFGT